MKFRLSLSLLAIFLIARGLGWCQSCKVGEPVPGTSQGIDCFATTMDGLPTCRNLIYDANCKGVERPPLTVAECVKMYYTDYPKSTPADKPVWEKYCSEHYGTQPAEPEKIAEPQKITCQVTQPAERPDVWDVRINVNEEQAKGEYIFHQAQRPYTFEHQSRKSALKECDKIITAREKLWKRERKKK